jgi:hypothetical protein
MAIIWILAVGGVLGALIVFGGLAYAIYHRVTEYKERAAALHAPPAADTAGTPAPRAGTAAPKRAPKAADGDVALPSIERHVPHHAVSIYDGCSSKDIDLIVTGIEDAIEVGAPLYNSGNLAGCYHMYEGAAQDIERRLSSTCTGPAAALRVGRATAAQSSASAVQAWAMRDAFDGLLDAAERKFKP